jgi:hypothetical protein
MLDENIYDSILKSKQKNKFFLGTVYSLSPFKIILDGDTIAIPCQSLTGLLDLREGARVVLLRYGKQYVAVGVIGEPAKSMIPLSRLFFSFDTTLYSNLGCNSFDYTRNSVAYNPDTGAEVPADTPIFMPFSGEKQGLLMEEETTNLANNPTFSGAVGTTPSGWDSDVTIRQDDFFGQLINVAELLCVSGNTYEDFGTSIAYPLAYNTTYTISFWARGTMELTYELSTKRGIASATWKSKPPMSLQWQRYEVTIVTASSGSIYPFWWYLYNANDVNVGKWVRIARIQLEQKPYPTTFTVGTRANPKTLLTLPEALPDTFGIDISTKMLHAHDIADRTFWQCGGYRCYFDSADNKIKLTNGVVTAETAAVSWAVDDYVGIYAGRQNGKLFLQAKIAGALTDRVEVEAGAGAGTGETLYVGSRADGSESVNAVLADLVFHVRPEDIFAATWQEYEAHVDNTTDAHGIDEHFDATAEDDVHGLAGKVIVESGSNENGYYVRWDDGTQICWRSVNPDRTKQYTEQAFDFAKSFIASPAASASHYWGTNPGYQLSCATMFLAANATQWRIAFTNTSVTGADLPVRLTAIGRWK